VRVFCLTALLVVELCSPLAGSRGLIYAQAAPQVVPGGAAKAVGVIKAVAGNNITLTTDAGVDVTVLVQDGARLVRVPPGQTDLKEATPIQVPELQAGDRLLVRGKFAEDGKSVLATSVIAMKKSDVADKQAHEREEWQRHGIGGLVGAVDAANSAVTISTVGLTGSKNVVIHLAKTSIIRRYAPDSVKFDDAKPSTLEQIKAGDQVRARGTRSAEGSEFSADEIVSGSFRNIAGTISSVDAAGSTLNVADLATKKTVQVKITAESQLRKLGAAMAQRIAMRLKGASDNPPVTAGGSQNPGAAAPSVPRANGGAAGNGGANRGGGASDLQQAIQRMPAAALSDFQKGDAVMIVATEGTGTGSATAITLLGGVEPILEAGAATVLSPWSINAGGGDAGTP